MRALQLIPVALSVGGSDSSAGAGIQADLKTFAALGIHCVCAVTAITAQNSARVVSVAPLKPSLVVAQIEALVADAKIAEMKTGMLANARIVRAVADAIEKLRLPAPVVDPILHSTSGAALLDRAGERAMIDRLIPISRIVTPNLPEAEKLSGVRIRDRESMRRAAEKIIALGARAVVIKGGHLRGAHEALDIFFNGSMFREFKAPRVEGVDAHGTGCAFSAAIAAHLARGAELEDAVLGAKRFVTRAIRRSYRIGRGRAMLNQFAR